jgi:DegV family protein with EDD domain
VIESISLVTDSTSDLPAAVAEREGVTVVPALITLDGQSYQDGRELSRSEFYRRLPGLSQPATTAAPPPSAFEAAYEGLLGAGSGRVISVHLSRRLSAMHDIAVQAAKRFGERVHVVDSGQVSLGLGFQLLEAARAIRAGGTFASILQVLDRARDRSRTLAMIESMEYLRRSGRVDWLRSSLGQWLHVRLLLEVVDGFIRRVGQARTRGRAIDELLALAARWGAVERWGVMHSGVAVEAEALAARLPVDGSPEPSMIVDVTTVIGVHVGPSCLGLAGFLR